MRAFISRIFEEFCHVLGEDLPCPNIPPYYNKAFFDTINEAKNDGNLVETMSTRQWYDYLLEGELTTIVSPDQPRQLIPSRTDSSSPTSDWPTIWERTRLPGLGSEARSFIWRLINDLLPTENRLFNINPNSSPNCRHCQDDVIADLEHCMFYCCMTDNMGYWLLSTFRQQDPLANPLRILKLEIEGSDGLVWVTIQSLLLVYNSRKAGKPAAVIEIKAKMMADITLLLNTNHNNMATLALSLIQNS